MQLYKITKGNFCLDKTKDIRPHSNNLRFHIKKDEKYYKVVHKGRHIERYTHVVKLDHLSVVKRRKFVT